MRTSIVICSTRPGRIGPAIAGWALEVARGVQGVEPELLDLADIALPIYDEQSPPRLKKYQHGHTKSFSSLVGRSEAFLLVTPEYNHNPPPPLTNALTYLNAEWAYKPVSFLSYGGISGGLRSVQAVKLILLALKAVPILEGIVVPFAAKQISEKRFKPTDVQCDAAELAFSELKRWNSALSRLR